MKTIAHFVHAFPKRNLPFRFIIFLLTSCLFATHAGQAQTSPDPKDELPPGPLIQKRAGEYSCWTVTQKAVVQNSKPSSGQEKEPNYPTQTVSYIKTGNILRTVIVDSEKRAWNIWTKQGIQVVVWPDQKGIGHSAKPTSSSDHNPLYIDLSASDFPGFEWISAETFKGIKTVSGKKCLIFQSEKKLLSDPETDNGISNDSTASIDFETRLPATLVNAYGLFEYKFQTAPTAMQTLPDKVEEYLTKEHQKNQSLAKRSGVAY